MKYTITTGKRPKPEAAKEAPIPVKKERKKKDA